tara:strand:+ start:775 stop:969 length:195 start_codon:yes stop_codon:yes gene_type:complete
MDYVQAKKIVSPYSGSPSSPKIFEKDYGDRIVTEAWWYCPDSGQFITKGIVKEVMKDVPTKPKL